MRRWTAASLLVVASLYGRETGLWAVAIAVAAIIVGALAAGPRLALSPAASRIAAAAAAAAGGALGWLVVPELGAPLRAPWPSFALAGLLAGAALLCRGRQKTAADTSPDAPTRTTSALALLPGLAALTACGEAPIGAVYAVFASLHLALALLALHEGDAPRSPGYFPPLGALAALPARRLAALAAVLALAAAVAAGSVAGLPPLSQWTQARILRSLGGPQAGFSDRMWLGSLDGLFQSDEVVMRIEGARTDYLRGAVYDHYEVGRWGRQHFVRPSRARFDARPEPGAERVHVSLVSGARDGYFLPLNARAIVSPDPDVTVDRYAVVHVPSGSAEELTFSLGTPPDLPLADPTDDDLALPPDLRRQLQRIADVWTAGATTPEARVSAIAERLRTLFTYSLHFEAGRRRDPLLDFFENRRGHCEYFASAMTLLARAAGVPARAVVGFRVAEENPLGHYWIVRERHAHAWTEVYLPGRGFVTVDATPPGAIAADEPHQDAFGRALWDLVGATFARAKARVTLLHVAGALVGVAAVGLAVRRLRRGGARAGRVRVGRAAFARAPRALERLLEALARRGAVRPASEPLERFAERLAGPEMEAAAEILRRWAAFRYGGVGEQEGLLREMEGCAERLRRR